MKLTKEERFTIYCIMLGELEEKQRNDDSIWMCHILEEILFHAKLYTEVAPQLTEFWKRKPKVTDMLSGGWFSGYDFNSRKKLLTDCINELGNELYSNN